MDDSLSSLRAENQFLRNQISALESSQSDLFQKYNALKEYLRLSFDDKNNTDCPDDHSNSEMVQLSESVKSSQKEISRLNDLIDTLQKENFQLSSLVPHPRTNLKRAVIAIFVFFFVIVVPLFASYEEQFIQFSHHHIQSHTSPSYRSQIITPAWADYPLSNLETLRNVSDNQSLVPGTIFDPPVGRITDLRRANATLYGNKQLIHSAYTAGKSCYIFVSGEPTSDGLDCMFGVLGTLLMSYEGLRGY